MESSAMKKIQKAKYDQAKNMIRDIGTRDNVEPGIGTVTLIYLGKGLNVTIGKRHFDLKENDVLKDLPMGFAGELKRCWPCVFKHI